MSAFDFEKPAVKESTSNRPTAFDFDGSERQRPVRTLAGSSAEERLLLILRWTRSSTRRAWQLFSHIEQWFGNANPREKVIIVAAGSVAVVVALTSFWSAIANATILSPQRAASDYMSHLESGRLSATEGTVLASALSTDPELYTDKFYGRVGDRPQDAHVDSYSVDGDEAYLTIRGTQGGESFTTTLVAHNSKWLGVLNHWSIEPLTYRVEVPEPLSESSETSSWWTLNDAPLSLEEGHFAALPGRYTLAPAQGMRDTVQGEVEFVVFAGWQEAQISPLADEGFSGFPLSDQAVVELETAAESHVNKCMEATAVEVPECLLDPYVSNYSAKNVSWELTGRPEFSSYLSSVFNARVLVSAEAVLTYESTTMLFGSGIEESSVPVSFLLEYAVGPEGDLTFVKVVDPLSGE